MEGWVGRDVNGGRAELKGTPTFGVFSQSPFS